MFSKFFKKDYIYLKIILIIFIIIKLIIKFEKIKNSIILTF